MKETLNFGTERVDVLFRKVFIPTVLGMLSLSAVTTIDGIFVGHGVGSEGIAAVNICVPLLMFLQGVGLMAGAGCSVMTSVSLSQHKHKEARAFVTHAIGFVTLIALIVIGVTMTMPYTVGRLLGSSEHLMPYVIDYLVWFAPSLLFQMWLEVALYVIRLDGAPRLAMWSSILNAVLNALLDWLLIFPLGMGIKGAAIATSISCFAGATLAMGYLLFFAKSVRLKRPQISLRGVRFFVQNTVEQCRIGLSAFLTETTMAMLFFVGNLVFIHYLGDDGVSAFGISCYYLPFIFMIGNAIAQSTQPIISYNYGIGDTARIHEALRLSLKTAVVCGVLPTLFFVCTPRPLVRLFLPLNTPAAQLAIDGFPYYAAGFAFLMLNLSLIGYYQSLERVRPAMFFALLRGIIFLVPCFVCLPMLFGTHGIWFALSASEILTFCTIVAMHYKTTSPKKLELSPRTSPSPSKSTPLRKACGDPAAGGGVSTQKPRF